MGLHRENTRVTKLLLCDGEAALEQKLGKDVPAVQLLTHWSYGFETRFFIHYLCAIG